MHPPVSAAMHDSLSSADTPRRVGDEVEDDTAAIARVAADARAMISRFLDAFEAVVAEEELRLRRGAVERVFWSVPVMVFISAKKVTRISISLSIYDTYKYLFEEILL